MRRFCSFFLLFSITVTNQPSFAQDRSVEEILDTLESQPTTKESSARARLAVDKMVGDFNESQPSSPDIGTDTSPSSITHFRMAGGLPLPTRDQVITAPFVTLSNKEIDAIADSVLGPAILGPTSKPKKCLYDRTTYVEGSGGNREKLLSDTLYVSENLVPSDPDEAFGESTVVYSYKEEGDESTYRMINTSAAPCVPYRIRIVSNGQFLDEGKNALRNYSKAQGGKGLLAPSMAEKLGLTASR